MLLQSDGKAVACGDNVEGQSNIPPLHVGTSYTHVSSGYADTVLLRSDGCVVTCGFDSFDECGIRIPPLDEETSYIQVAAGDDHTVLLRSDGSAVACGHHGSGRCQIPPLGPGDLLPICRGESGDPGLCNWTLPPKMIHCC